MRFWDTYEQLGVFSYEEDGFSIQLAEGPKKYFYSQIEAIIAYKVDRGAYDEMRLEVILTTARCASRKRLRAGTSLSSRRKRSFLRYQPTGIWNYLFPPSI